MADVLIRMWQWGAPLEPLGDEAPAIQRDLAARLVRLSQQHESLRGLKIETNVDSMTHVRASLVHSIHNFQCVLEKELVLFNYQPPRGVQPETLGVHLEAVAQPILGAITSSTWFQSGVRRSHYFYSLEVTLKRTAGRRPALDHLIGSYASALARPEQTAHAALRPVMRSAPHQLAIRTTAKARAARTSFDLSVEIVADRKQPDLLRSSVILLSPDKQRARAPWLGNVGALHEAVWPAVERFFDDVEERRGERSGKETAKTSRRATASHRNARGVARATRTPARRR